jgi:hypothetical protein
VCCMTPNYAAGHTRATWPSSAIFSARPIDARRGRRA